MRKIFSEVILKPSVLIFLWLIFLLSPLLSVFRLYFIVNNNLLGFRIRGFSSFLLYFPFFISVVVFLILVLWFKEFIDKKLTSTRRNVLMVLSFLSVIFLVVWGGLLSLEQRNYPNFLYEHFGITVYQLEFMSFVAALELLVFLSILTYSLTFKIQRNKQLKRELIGGAKTEKASLFLAVAGFSALVILSAYPFLNWSLLVNEAKGNLESRVGVHYKYLLLLSDHTPEDARVIHPPQGNKWPAIGNQPVIRYFLYPRTLISGALLNNNEFAKNIGDAYFTEIDPELESTHWPTVDIGKKTVIFNETTKVEYERLEIIFESQKGKVFRIFF